MSTDILFAPLQFGALALPHRIVMPALTRMRAGPRGVPQAISAEYYAQRASAGLIITEATAISVQGQERARDVSRWAINSALAPQMKASPPSKRELTSASDAIRK